MIPLATDKNGCLLLCACIYTLATDEDRKAKFANTRTGEVRILTNKDYENILSKREMEVLRLIDQGLLSKEISDNLCISINTVNIRTPVMRPREAMTVPPGTPGAPMAKMPSRAQKRIMVPMLGRWP